ncbi:hypothetical protein GOODEAATRI_005481 [Goodea atripinnis]|uniref:Ankyrin repeat domain 24 n=1 Tax=Goodea atripinnis TaxID=208336 RepID=A0ABV0PL36_9TELE
MLACESDSVETVEALLRGGANTKLVDQLGHKAADYAITTGNQCIVHMLQDGVPPVELDLCLSVIPLSPPHSPFKSPQALHQCKGGPPPANGKLLHRLALLSRTSQQDLPSLQVQLPLPSPLSPRSPNLHLPCPLKLSNHLSKDGSQNGGEDPESTESLKENLRVLKERLASSQSELEELKEQMRLGVLSVECAEGTISAAAAGATEECASQEEQQLRARVTELEEKLAERQGEAEGQISRDNDTIKQLTEKVKELQAALTQKESVLTEEVENKRGEAETETETETVKSLCEKIAELEAALAESRTSGKEGAEAGDGDRVRRLQERLAELEGDLRKCVPRSELEEVQVTLGLQCEQLARERAEVARRLNDALLELERLRPPQRGDDEEEEEEEHSESSEPSVMSELQRTLQASESSAAAAQEALCEKETELRELKSQKAAEQGLISKEDHEALRLSLQADINAITARFNDLTRKHEKTCTEVFQVQREALFHKSERQAAESQLVSVQKQLSELQSQSSHIQELHKDIQESQGLVKEKDRKVRDCSSSFDNNLC